MEEYEFGLNKKDRIIYLHNMGGENSVDYKMSSQFIKNMDILASVKKPITIKLISCEGGELSDALAIYSAIRLSGCKTTIIGYGFICSSGTLIMQGATKRILTKESEFMIHRGVVSSEHTLNARSTVKSNHRINKRMLDIYADRCMHGSFFTERSYSFSKTRSYLDTKIKNDGDVWLTPEEALELGFIDGIS
jgi:ATP-dependent protease ClpP protease subunit